MNDMAILMGAPALCIVLAVAGWLGAKAGWWE